MVDHYFMPDAKIGFKSGGQVSTDILNNAAELSGTFYAADVLVSVALAEQKPKNQRVRSGAGFKVYSGMREPASFTIKMMCQSGVPLGWVCKNDKAANTHVCSRPTDQTMSVTAANATGIPALCIRIQGESATNANYRVDLLGILPEELTMEVEDGGKVEYTFKGKALMVFAATTTVTIPAERALTVFGWEHFTLAAFTYSTKTVGFTPKSFRLTITVEWEPITPATKATIYQVYTSALMKSWDVEIEMKGLAFSDGTSLYIDPFTIARLMPNSSVLTTADYATAIAITPAFTRTTASDDMTLAISSVEMTLDEHESSRDTAGYKECTRKGPRRRARSRSRCTMHWQKNSTEARHNENG
jgi:hypothetical protein